MGKAVDSVINPGKLVLLRHFDSERSRYVSQVFEVHSQSSQEDEADASGFSPVLILSFLYFSCSPFLSSLRLPHFLPPSPIRLPRWLSSKESTRQCRRCRFDPWVGKISWRRKWQPTPVFLPGKSHGQQSLEGYSPWSGKESDTTEHARTYIPISSSSFPPSFPFPSSPSLPVPLSLLCPLLCLPSTSTS